MLKKGQKPNKKTTEWDYGKLNTAYGNLQANKFLEKAASKGLDDYYNEYPIRPKRNPLGPRTRNIGTGIRHEHHFHHLVKPTPESYYKHIGSGGNILPTTSPHLSSNPTSNNFLQKNYLIPEYSKFIH